MLHGLFPGAREKMLEATWNHFSNNTNKRDTIPEAYLWLFSGPSNPPSEIDEVLPFTSLIFTSLLYKERRQIYNPLHYRYLIKSFSLHVPRFYSNMIQLAGCTDIKEKI